MKKTTFIITCLILSLFYFSSCDKKNNEIERTLTFRNNTLTDVELIIEGKDFIIEPSGILYKDIKTDKNIISYEARTLTGLFGNVSTWWPNEIDLNGEHLEINFDIVSDCFYLKIKNESSKKLKNLCFNTDFPAILCHPDLEIDNDGKEHEIGYFKIIPDMYFEMQIDGQDEVIRWNVSDFDLPNEENQFYLITYTD